MESHRDQYHIAWILSTIDDHLMATNLFDERFSRDISSSGIAYTTGRVGHHNIVAVSNNATSQNSAGDIADALLRTFPAIRAGFLVSTDGIVPRNGNVRVGDVVVGIGSRVHTGVAQFDLQETIKQKRLFVTNLSRSPPRAILRALYALNDPSNQEEWLRRLNKNELQPKAFRGLIASSDQRLNDPALIDSIGAQSHALCFETAAVNLKHRPFTVISGIASCSGETQPQLSSNDVNIVVASYAACLTHSIDSVKLAAEIPIVKHFQYEAFDLDRPGFRLLRLQAGTGPIRCHVFQAYLDDESLIPYESLSYCWGSNLLTDEIFVNGKVLPVTSNLAEALPHLRHVNEDRILWIDAICIDQSNVRERGHQVGCMGHIYSRAERVLIWLGYTTHLLRPLISSLKGFEKRVPPCAWRDWLYADPRWCDVWEEAQINATDRHESDHISQKDRFKLLTKMPWFSRVWILQEVAKAEKAQIGCTAGWINARSFALTSRILGLEPGIQCQAVIDIMPGLSRESSWWAEKQNLCTLLWRFRGSQASDPRDRLYALLDLASDMNIKEKIKVDYTKSEKAVIDDITSYLFNENACKFVIRDIADLQQKIPNLSCMALERMILSEGQIKKLQVQEFLLRQNKTVWLSETAVSYLWCVRPELMDYFLNEAAIEHVAMGHVHETTILNSTVTLESFGNKRNKKVEITPGAIEASHRNGINLPALVLRQSRHDIKITQTLVEDAMTQGVDTFKLLLDRRGYEFDVTEAVLVKAIQSEAGVLKLLFERRGKDVNITDDVIKASHQNGIDIVRLKAQCRHDNIKITESLFEESLEKGPDSLELLLGRRGDQILSWNMRKKFELALTEGSESSRSDLMDVAIKLGLTTPPFELFRDTGPRY
ncbi:heterokaryon incompatibility protein-domain-containing protein [Dactylonectria macrodidyma]|uniref:Heterokaryon incompatibility protein-domain-containing protein n=1 Tax=Dactylonectria macrodidyma TaxID=307937 RepID=A0A9P9F8K7_9HYPO|nr:heterokaryon incompatibility protein-domain-containing protein [Dactylonectria macrodidyma]